MWSVVGADTMWCVVGADVPGGPRAGWRPRGRPRVRGAPVGVHDGVPGALADAPPAWLLHSPSWDGVRSPLESAAGMR